MIEVAEFKKVSYEEFERDVRMLLFTNNDTNVTDIAKEAYEHIVIPERKTAMSAGYDICTPFNISMAPGSSMVIPTGLRCNFSEPGWFLGVYLRSSIGFKYNTVLANTVGIIDPDYYFADNEGHIMIKLRYEKDNGNITNHVLPYRIESPNYSEIGAESYILTNIDAITKKLTLSAGDRFVQGIFHPYGCTYHDNTTTERTGGIGSTGK